MITMKGFVYHVSRRFIKGWETSMTESLMADLVLYELRNLSGMSKAQIGEGGHLNLYDRKTFYRLYFIVQLIKSFYRSTGTYTFS